MKGKMEVGKKGRQRQKRTSVEYSAKAHTRGTCSLREWHRGEFKSKALFLAICLNPLINNWSKFSQVILCNYCIERCDQHYQNNEGSSVVSDSDRLILHMEYKIVKTINQYRLPRGELESYSTYFPLLIISRDISCGAKKDEIRGLPQRFVTILGEHSMCQGLS